MAATAAALNTYIQTVEPARKLKVLTNFGTNSAGSVDETVLTAFCQKAINWFGAAIGTYDPDNYLAHQDATHYKTMEALYSRADDEDKVADYEGKVAEILDGLRRTATFKTKHILSPLTNSQFTPTEPDAGTKPWADDDQFDGYVSDSP